MTLTSMRRQDLAGGAGGLGGSAGGRLHLRADARWAAVCLAPGDQDAAQHISLVILHAKCTTRRLNDFNVYASRQVGVVFENDTCSITLGVFTAPGLAPPPTPPPPGPKKTYCDPQHKHSPVPQMCPLQGVPPTCGSIVVQCPNCTHPAPGLGCQCPNKFTRCDPTTTGPNQQFCPGSPPTPCPKARKPPGWPRSWANFSLFQLYSHRNAWSNLHSLGQPNTLLAQGARQIEQVYI